MYGWEEGGQQGGMGEIGGGKFMGMGELKEG